MKFVKYLITLFALWPAYFLLKVLPRSKNIWCFSSYRDSFVDNSKYLFHYVSINHPEIDCYWVTDDSQLLQQLKTNGYKVVKRKSLRGAMTIIRAKYVVYSSYVAEVNFWLTSGAKLINLYHGLPLKKIEFDIDSGALQRKYSEEMNLTRMHRQLFFPSAYRVPDLMFAPTAKMEEIFRSAFRLKGDTVVNCGSPRTDQFFDNESFSSLNTGAKVVDDSHEDRKIFIYMPTFRDVGGEFFSKENFDFASLNKTMAKVNGEFWIKAHPAAGVEHIDLSHYGHIKLLPSNIDMYPVLKNSHALITDYSSIYIDYLLLDKPIYFYCFDIENYKKNCRSMYFNYDEITPGVKSLNFSSLLYNITLDSDEFAIERKAVKNLFWGKEYHPACQSIVERILL